MRKILCELWSTIKTAPLHDKHTGSFYANLIQIVILLMIVFFFILAFLVDRFGSKLIELWQ